ncbi:lysylphosphatidylglycerol synthase domain-containing protein [Halosegnis marinus]|uniref:lysylphosphatidylglycerol synthase domain-containing protein n=1 Tax=Halosegnis marinus TaxID=3034023 RepID=UPI00361B25FC
MPVLAVVGWRYRYRVEGAAIRAVTPVVRFLGRVVPGRMPPARDAIRSRVEGFFHAIERVTGDRRRLALALGFSTLGWLCLATSLWLSLAALGEAVAYPVVLVVVPVGAIAGITPLPGGSAASRPSSSPCSPRWACRPARPRPPSSSTASAPTSSQPSSGAGSRGSSGRTDSRRPGDEASPDTPLAGVRVSLVFPVAAPLRPAATGV